MIPQRKRFYILLVGLVSLFILLRRDFFSTSARERWEADAVELIKHAPESQKDKPVIGAAVKDQTGKVTSRTLMRWEDYQPYHPMPLADLAWLPHGEPVKLPRIQHEFTTESAEEERIRLQRQAAVKETFERCWNSYKKNAWKMYELSPISGRGVNGDGGWGSTLVGSLDTLWIMGMKKDFKEAVDAAVKIDFGPASVSKLEEINIYETNVRILGGLLGAYDLSRDPRLLKKAVEVGNMIHVAFDTPNHMPLTRWKPKFAADGHAQIVEETILSAELGSFSLEFTRLSQLTGNMKWHDAAQRITDLLEKSQLQTRLPGMWDVALEAKTLDFTTGGTFKLGASTDSMYEYFSKTYALLGGQSQVYKKLYVQAAGTAIKHTIFKPATPDQADILMVGEIEVDDKGKFSPKLKGEHLGCFAGGMLGLGGKLTGNNEHVEVGRKLTYGCIWAYNHSALGIMPEKFEMTPCPKSSKCAWSDDAWKENVRERHGIYAEGAELDRKIEEMRLPQGFVDISDRRYILRPEAIESIFVMYRITGDKSLLDAAWEMFSAIEKYTKTTLANAAILDVTVAKGPALADRMESFWYAQTLKYFYLVFSDPDLISLDEYVLNTEGHPFKMSV